MTTDTATKTTTLPTPAKVLWLQSQHDYPTVSVLMSTRRGPSMHPDDSARLGRLVLEATARLRAERLADASVLADSLERLADRAVSLPTADAVGLFVNKQAHDLVHLPVTVQDRVVVDPTFATRDLVRALHRTPRHVVLTLSSREARLFEGAADSLMPVLDAGFPVRAQARQRGHGRADRGERASRRDAAVDPAFLRRVDAALGNYLRARPAPLVLIGGARTTSAFRAVSRNLTQLAGTVAANLTSAPVSALRPRVRSLLEDYLRSRERDAMTLLDQRVGEHRAVSGIQGAWLAARAEQPEMLAVEEGFFFAARLTADGDYVMRADDVEHPDVIDDIVDELIETVLERGGWVALVRDGALSAHDRVALTLRASPGTRQ